ncbi:MAG: ribosome silencing factor [Caldimonas sp.]
MDIRKLQRVIVDGLEDVKAQNIVVFNTEHLSPLFERVIVASGTSNRQTRSLAASVRDAVKSAGEPPPRTEGEDNGEWIIVDCGAAVVHVMQPAIREYYHLEELWGDKPVRMKIGADGPTRLVRAATPVREERAPARRAAAPNKPAGTTTTAANRKTAAKKSPAVTKAPAAKKAVARASGRPAGRKAAPARHVVRTVGVKSAAKAASKTAAAAPRGAARAGPATRRPAAKKAGGSR